MIRVLITDDHLIVRAGLRLILETADDIEIVGEAKDGAECLELVPALKPDLILMDLQMPRMDGITNDRSKYIPITDDNLFENDVAASWDAMSILYSNRPDARIFDRKNLIMGGSLTPMKDKLVIGDVSAILLNRMPAVGRPFYSPDFETAILPDWEDKIEKMAHQCSKDDIVMFAGVPTWSLVLFKRILEITGKKNIREVWPNLRTYFHGGVGFDPYIDQFKALIPGDDIEYMKYIMHQKDILQYKIDQRKHNCRVAKYRS